MYYIEYLKKNYHLILRCQSYIQEIDDKYKEFRNLITHCLHDIRYLYDVQKQDDNLDKLQSS